MRTKCSNTARPIRGWLFTSPPPLQIIRVVLTNGLRHPCEAVWHKRVISVQKDEIFTFRPMLRQRAVARRRNARIALMRHPEPLILAAEFIRDRPRFVHTPIIHHMAHPLPKRLHPHRFQRFTQILRHLPRRHNNPKGQRTPFPLLCITIHILPKHRGYYSTPLPLKCLSFDTTPTLAKDLSFGNCLFPVSFPMIQTYRKSQFQCFLKMHSHSPRWRDRYGKKRIARFLHSRVIFRAELGDVGRGRS